MLKQTSPSAVELRAAPTPRGLEGSPRCGRVGFRRAGEEVPGAALAQIIDIDTPLSELDVREVGFLLSSPPRTVEFAGVLGAFGSSCPDSSECFSNACCEEDAKSLPKS